MVIIETFSITSWILTNFDDVTYLGSNVRLQFQRTLQGIDTRIPGVIDGHLKVNHFQHTANTILQTMINVCVHRHGNYHSTIKYFL
jgi:hypothetical protein